MYKGKGGGGEGDLLIASGKGRWELLPLKECGNNHKEIPLLQWASLSLINHPFCIGCSAFLSGSQITTEVFRRI